MFEPLDKKRYSEQIAQMIQERIFKENLEGGSKLPSERQLAEELNVSRSVVREAVRMLDASGLVNIRRGPRGGIFVSHVYHKPLSNSLKNLAAHGQVTVDHLFDVRLHVEPYMAKQAARYATGRDMEKLRSLTSDAALLGDDPATLKGKNITFHVVLAEASSNPVFTLLMNSISELLGELAYRFVDPSYEKHFLRSHRKILQAIEARKPAEVGRLVHDDILDVKKKLKTFLAQERKEG